MSNSKLKLERVASLCGSTIAADTLGQMIDDPRYTADTIAAAAGVSLSFFEMVMSQPEPTVYGPTTTTNVEPA